MRPGLAVRLNQEAPSFTKPKRGALCVRLEGRILLETYDAARPFPNLKALDLDSAAQAVLDAVDAAAR